MGKLDFLTLEEWKFLASPLSPPPLRSKLGLLPLSGLLDSDRPGLWGTSSLWESKTSLELDAAELIAWLDRWEEGRCWMNPLFCDLLDRETTASSSLSSSEPSAKLDFPMLEYRDVLSSPLSPPSLRFKLGLLPLSGLFDSDRPGLWRASSLLEPKTSLWLDVEELSGWLDCLREGRCGLNPVSSDLLGKETIASSSSSSSSLSTISKVFFIGFCLISSSVESLTRPPDLFWIDLVLDGLVTTASSSSLFSEMFANRGAVIKLRLGPSRETER